MAAMPIPRIAFVLLAGMGALCAEQLPALRTEAVNAGSVLSVKNTGAQPLTAYLIELVDYPGSSFTLFQDDVAGAIAPGAEKRIPVSNMTIGAAPEYVKITAAVYADGTTAGDPAKVALILGRRKAMLETSRELAARLEKAKAAGSGKAEVAAALKEWSASLQTEARARRMSVASVSEAAARAIISNAVARLGVGSIDDVLQEVRANERALAAAKP
jgi:hypothetical protein